MQPQELARNLGVTSNTVRRWCEVFHPYLSPIASPPKGKTRVLTDLDVRILAYVGTARDLGQPLEMIEMRLKAMQDRDWSDLPDVPWSQHVGETIPVPAAAARADEMVTVAILQRDLQHVQNALAESQQRVEVLESELIALRASQTATEAEKTAMRLELERARGEVATLQARLSAYAITGGDQPIPVAAIILVTALAVALLVIVLLVVVRLVL